LSHFTCAKQHATNAPSAGDENEGDEAEGDESEGDEAEGDEAEGDEAEADEADGDEQGEDGEDEHPSAEQQSADETAAKAAAHDASDEEQRVEEARVKQTVAGGDPVALAPATNATETAKDVSQDDPRERAWQVRVAGCCAAVLAGVSPFSRVPRILSLSLSVCVRM